VEESICILVFGDGHSALWDYICDIAHFFLLSWAFELQKVLIIHTTLGLHHFLEVCRTHAIAGDGLLLLNG
jgi:hypothetical protein